MSHSRTKRSLRNLGLLVVTVAAGLVIMEWGLRAAASAAGATHSMRLLQSEADGPCRVIPNLRLETVIDGEDILIETNDIGMRWRDVQRAKPPEVRRIAFVGDSFTFGEWSTTAETSFVGVVDRHLGPLGFEVLNFGVPGDGPMELEERLKTYILSFDPDTVVLNLFNGNDLSDTLLGPDKTDCETGDVRRDLVRSKVPAEFLETPFQTLKRTLDHHSRLFHALRVAKGRLTGDVRFVDHGDQESRQASLPIEERLFAPAFWSRRDYPSVAISAKDEMIATLSRIHDLAVTHGFDLVLTALPFREQVYTDALTGTGYDLALPQRYVSALAAERGIPFYDLLADFRQQVEDCGLATYVRSDPHFNTTGHRLAGELITRFLQGVLKRDTPTLPPLACDLMQPSGDRDDQDLTASLD